MTRDEAKVILERGDMVWTGAWHFSKSYMSCHEDNCCSDCYDTSDEALDSIEWYCAGCWEDVTE